MSKPTLRAATLADLQAKPPIERVVEVEIGPGTIVNVRYQALGRAVFEALKRDHAPTEAQAQDYQKAAGEGKELAWNTETFPAALCAASSVEPKMTTEEVSALFETWTDAEISRHFMAALVANTSDSRVDQLGKALSGTNG